MYRPDDHADTTPFWAITCYFNPSRYETRRRNYLHFRRCLDVPLVCVEWSSNGRWELSRQDAEVMVRVAGGDVMWQKERLLNIALSHVPSGCEHVAYLDCDILFLDPSWSSDAARLLGSFPLVQLFRDVHYMPQYWNPDLGFTSGATGTRRSIASGVLSGLSFDQCIVHPSPTCRPGTFNSGLAWAARRGLLEDHGFFDANIIGGGDRAMSCAAYGNFQHVASRHQMSTRHLQHYLNWAQAYHHDVRGHVSCIDGAICHLWHGDTRNRGLSVRHGLLAEHEFDPLTDIVQTEQGVWRWNSNKPEMHRMLREYFASRSEDG